MPAQVRRAGVLTQMLQAIYQAGGSYTYMCYKKHFSLEIFDQILVKPDNSSIETWKFQIGYIVTSIN